MQNYEIKANNQHDKVFAENTIFFMPSVLCLIVYISLASKIINKNVHLLVTEQRLHQIAYFFLSGPLNKIKMYFFILKYELQILTILYYMSHSSLMY